MSLADDWAKRRLDAVLAARHIDSERPGESPKLFVRPCGGMLTFEVSDLGNPVLVAPNNVRHEIEGQENVLRLLDLARWVLATFGDG